ncbi:membrane protein [Gordonia phage Diabla]|nr:membrane protein [Gordonia phage Diabla]
MPTIIFNGGHLFLLVIIAVVVWACCTKREL